MTEEQPCSCSKKTYGFTAKPVSCNVGGYTTNGRYGWVYMKCCALCGRVWLYYEVEYAAFTNSGRWFRGVVGEESINAVTPENATQILAGMEWYIRGGCWFDSGGEVGTGAPSVDLFG